MEIRPVPASADPKTYVPTANDLNPVGQYKAFGDMFPGTSSTFVNSYDKTGSGSATIITVDNKPFNIFIHTYNKNFHTLDKAQKMYGIMMVSVIFFGPALGSMSLFGSTDRPLFNLIGSSLRGVILLIPFLLIFSSITKGMSHDIVMNNLGKNGIFTQEFFF